MSTLFKRKEKCIFIHFFVHMLLSCFDNSVFVLSIIIFRYSITYPTTDKALCSTFIIELMIIRMKCNTKSYTGVHDVITACRMHRQATIPVINPGREA